MNTLKVSLYEGGDLPQCVFDLKPCATEHPNVKISRLAAKLLSPYGMENTEVQFVPCNGVNSTLLDQIEMGVSNLSAYYLTLTESRMEKFESAAPIQTKGYAFIFKKSQRLAIKLNFFEIVPWQCMVMLLCFGLFWKSLKGLSTNSWALKSVMTRSSVVVGLAIQLLLGYISSNVVLLFNQQTFTPKVFSSLHDIAQAVHQGLYVPIAQSELIVDSYFFQNISMGSSAVPSPFHLLHDSTKLYGRPRSNIGTKEGLDFIANAKGKPHIFIMEENDLHQLLSYSCELEYFVDRSAEHMETMYYAKSAKMRPLSTVDIMVIRTEMDVARKSFYKPKHCSEASSMQDDSKLSLSQINTLPLILFAASCVGLVIVLCENIYHALSGFVPLGIFTPSRNKCHFCGNVFDIELVKQELKLYHYLCIVYNRSNESPESRAVPCIMREIESRIFEIQNKLK